MCVSIWIENARSQNHYVSNVRLSDNGRSAVDPASWLNGWIKQLAIQSMSTSPAGGGRWQLLVSADSLLSRQNRLTLNSSHLPIRPMLVPVWCCYNATWSRLLALSSHTCWKCSRWQSLARTITTIPFSLSLLVYIIPLFSSALWPPKFSTDIMHRLLKI